MPDQEFHRVYLSPPHLSPRERELLLEAFDSNWIAPLGPHVDALEKEFAQKVGAAEAVALSSGTAALHLAMLATGVAPGDDVLTSTLTFAATANAITYVGARPCFIDSNRATWNLDPELLAEELDERASAGKLPKAVVAVDLYGQCCDFEPIRESCQRHGVVLIEDAAEALGATYHGRSAGTLGQIGCFSFNGNKIITTGGGGMPVTNDEHIARRARYLTTQAKDDPVEFVHQSIGYNYRLPNVLAAIGCAQLECLGEYVQKKRAIAAAYTGELGSLPGITAMREPPGTLSTFWMYTVRINPAEGRPDSREILRMLESEGVQTRPLWQPMHLSPAHRGSFATDCTIAERLNRDCLSLPCSVGLEDERQREVIMGVVSALRGGAA